MLYMVFVCFTEQFAGRWAARTFHNNVFVYNIYTFFECVFMSYGIYQCLKAYTRPKKIMMIGSAIFYICYFAFFLTHGIMPYNTWAASVLGVILTLYCFYYFYFVITAEELMDVNTNPEFWWMTAVLFFYFGSTTGNLFHELFSSMQIGNTNIRGLLFEVLVVIFYSLLAYSFICRSRQRKLQS